MSTLEKTETKTATGTGFHNGHRIRRGDTFNAPVDFKGKWFSSPSEPDYKAVTKDVEQPGVLGMTPAEVKEAAPKMTSQEINAAIGAETGSHKRKNVLAILRDELANRVGKIDDAQDDLLN